MIRTGLPYSCFHPGFCAKWLFFPPSITSSSGFSASFFQHNLFAAVQLSILLRLFLLYYYFPYFSMDYTVKEKTASPGKNSREWQLLYYSSNRLHTVRNISSIPTLPSVTRQAYPLCFASACTASAKSASLSIQFSKAFFLSVQPSKI